MCKKQPTVSIYNKDLKVSLGIRKERIRNTEMICPKLARKRLYFIVISLFCILLIHRHFEQFIRGPLKASTITRS